MSSQSNKPYHVESDYGPVLLDLCDGQLRSKVVKSIKNARSDSETQLNSAELDEVCAYINRLEDALLRLHQGLLQESEIMDHLKRCAGLDIVTLAFALDAMQAEDA